jgi:hypothetical protein
MADNDITPRVAVLEQIARATETALTDIRAELRDQRQAGRTQFHWQLGIIILVLLAQAALWQRVGWLEGQLTGISAQVSEAVSLLHQRAGG